MIKGQILLIEDNEQLGATISENLIIEGHEVNWVKDGKSGLDAALSQLHDIIILDLMLPNLNGIEVLKKIRENSHTPVLIISAKDSPRDRIRGLEEKADDYLPKPFHLKELLLRVQSLLRRKNSNNVETSFQVNVGKASIDFSAQTITVDSKVHQLSEKEVKILRLFISKKNQVVKREEILNHVWGYNEFPSTRTIDNFIVKIRKWIEPNPSNPKFMISHRGVGYSLRWSNE